MERSNGGRGVARVLGKLENSILEGNFYEAHQMYRTLFFRYSSQNKLDDCLNLLHSGATLFLEKEQYSSGADLILLLLTTLGKRSKPEKEEIDIWIDKLGNLIGGMKPTVVERQDIIVSIITTSVHEQENIRNLFSRRNPSTGRLKCQNHMRLHFYTRKSDRSFGLKEVSLRQGSTFFFLRKGSPQVECW